jgi:hypothetical protein
MTNQDRNESDKAGNGFGGLISIGLQSVDRLGRVLFDKQEQMLPNGDVWDELSEEDRMFWISSATSVITELQEILKEKTRGQNC